MEGYTNVVGSSYDFDDLDIEGRVVDEWNAEEEDKNTSKNEPMKLLDEKSILNQRVKLDNGQQADVFSVVRKQDNVWYTCHVCSDTMVGSAALKQHTDTSKHRTNMSKPIHPREKFIKLDPKENLALEPGEPVPPGLEEMIIKNALIQPKLDAYKSPLIGLEFMVELTESTLDETEYYYCLLCKKTGSERNMFIHFTSIFHYMNYLNMYFPTVAKKLQKLPNKKIRKKAFGLVVTDIVRDIEEKYGRLKPRSVTYSDFYFQGRKDELISTAFEGPHFKELDGETFEEKATVENVDKKHEEVLVSQGVTAVGKSEDSEKLEENKDTIGVSFNKANRINVDKKQLRTREEDNRNSSPDVQIVNVEQRKSPVKKKRTRSRSLSSLSSISSSSSHLRGKTQRHSHSRHHSKPSHRGWSRSRSRSPSYRDRHRRYQSPSYGRRYSPGRHRSRSPRRMYHHHRRDSRGRSPDPYKHRGIDRYGRQIRDKYESRGDRHRRDRTSEGRESPKEVVSAEEKVRWAKFREELKKVETVKLEKLKYHEKNPEKHPQYPEEWKAFWNRRYNELQRSGVDPSKHDFKPEWIAFWTKRMKELYEDELGRAKDELKQKFDLPEDPGTNTGMPWKYHQRKRNNTSPGLVDISPPTPDKKDVIADIKTTWKAFTGSDIKDTPKRPLSPWEDETPSTKRRQSRSPSLPPNANDKLLEDMPQRKSRTSALIFVLRKLTVLEQQLGSLAPKVFELMSQSLALEKIKEDASLDLLLEEDNSVFLETTREKLIALLCAGVVPRNFVNTARSAIKNTDIALYLASKKQRSLPPETVRAVMGGSLPSSQSVAMSTYPTTLPLPKSEPLVVPGVGQVDKLAIAQQIAAALVEQGKTNVTEGELEQLINAVVGMAEASANSAQPMTTAHFLQRIQAMQNPAGSIVPGATLPKTNPVVPPYNQTPIQTSLMKPELVVSEPQPSAAFGALKLLQSAYDESAKAEDSPKPNVVETAQPNTVISDKELASTLSVFNQLSKEEQPNFISRLKTSNPEMYKRLCPFIPPNVIIASDNPKRLSDNNSTKRSPITISLSKERSEQKIKPVVSGRLSPFSQRSGGGANPTIGDRVVIDDDDDDKNDVKIVSETPSKQQALRGNLNLKYKSNESDLDDDDDDDDYSYEDVYKAAQEKLRQKQLDEDDKSNISIASKETTNTEPKDTVKTVSDNSHQIMPPSNSGWNTSTNAEKPLLPTNDNFPPQIQTNENHFKTQQGVQQSSYPGNNNFPPQIQTNEDNFKTQQGVQQSSYPGNNNFLPQIQTNEDNFKPQQGVQQSSYPGTNNYNENPSYPARPDPYQSTAQSSFPYQGTRTVQERQQAVEPYTKQAQAPYGGGAPPNYPNKDQYEKESYYGKGNADYYNKNSQYPQDVPYSSTRDPYENPQRDSYSLPYNPLPYNTQGTTAYGNQMSSYDGDQYRYREPQYGADNYAQGRFPPASNPPAYPNSSVPPSRYPTQRYPPY